MIKSIKKYVSITIFCFAGSAFTPLSLYCADDLDAFFNDEEIDYFAEHTNFNATKANNPAEPAAALVDLGILSILQEELFLHTNPLVTRSLLDYPIFLPQRLYERPWTFGAHLFYNQTTRAVFDDNSTAICSYLAIQSPTLLTKLDSIATTLLPNELTLTPSNLASLFKNGTINERRTGFMFHMQHQSDRMRFRSMTPVYYFERNFFLTEPEQLAIEKALGKASEDEVELFAKNHLICDKIGVGDTRLNVDGIVYESEHAQVRLGALTTLPTAFTIGRAFLGSTFKKVEKRPILDIETLYYQAKGNQAQKDQAQDTIKTFALGVLDNLAANLLESELGNNKHIGIGGYYESKMALQKFIKLPWARNFTIRSRASLEYLLPKTEKRWFVECNDQILYDNLNLNRSTEAISTDIENDPVYAQAVLNFIQDQIVDILYPFTFKAFVHPGIILRSTSKLMYEVPSWGFFIGSDFWLASSEKLNNIKVIPAGPDRPPNINVEKARKKLAYESKIFGGAFWKVKRHNHEWLLSLNADGSSFGSGIGSNFTLSFNVELNF